MILDRSILPTLVPGLSWYLHTSPCPLQCIPMYYVLTYFLGRFGRYNIHTKVLSWLMTIYLIVTALTGFQFANLLPYLLQVVPIMSGFYTTLKPSPKPLPKPFPEPSPKKSPTHSTRRKKTDGSLTDHSFYNSASDEEPTKKRRQAKKSSPRDKSPTHKEHQGKPPSASPPPNSPPSSSSWDDTKPHPDYFPGFCHAPAGP
ncbi:hypothetical protein DSO57_1024401 [Entomophthora muscae]|uniref:Uncharacterized protein n=1 Tax=Entomophthora muscae TaxID=34485 RepID=A0ACC2T2U8_9FUNG|nr:hypothetical protein DSO57_1024401 [Entomophthora muscae]